MRRRRLPALLAALAAVSALSAAAPATQRSATARPVPFRAGETLTFDISWLQFITAGTATLTVRDRRPSFDSTAYYIVADGRPTPLLSSIYPLYYKADTLLDVFTLLPQRGSVFAQERSRSSLKATRFNQAARRASYEVTGARAVRKEVVLPAFTQDVLSALYVIRALPLTLGASVAMPVTDSGEIYRVQLQVVAQQSMTTPMGKATAWKVVPSIVDERGTPTGQTIAIWISDDERKLPLKIEADLPVGQFVILLTSVKG